jgi:uncharacterized repeat protein (TIGR03803 family)
MQENGKWTEKTLHVFDGINGSYPNASLLFDKAGNLYGAALKGGRWDDGAIFRLTLGANGKWTQTMLHSFDFNDGRWRNGNLIQDSSGHLYGTTVFGGTEYSGGTVFEIVP